jgi:hypothetical protein
MYSAALPAVWLLSVRAALLLSAECSPSLSIHAGFDLGVPVQIGVGADLEAKFPQDKLTDTPCIKVSNKTGSNAYQPANYVMQTLSGDPELRSKKDGSKVCNCCLRGLCYSAKCR